MMKKDFTTFDIIKALKIPRDRLRDWMRKGYIKPTIDANGQGTKAIFSRQDVYRVQLFQHLLKMGLHRKLAVQFLEKYNESKISHHAGRCMIIRHGARLSRDEEKYGKYFSKFIVYADQKIDLVKGSVDDDELAADFDERWDYIQIVNLRRLEQKTDEMLETL